MDLEMIGITADTVGKLMVAFTALRVHHRVLKEHQIDDQVFSSMRREQIVGVLGVVFMVAGYAIKVAARY
ncbi:hypothetical protein AMJ57_03880 [Parcubacteria bacterium SG8_24]|nr:MAG: hypothetical protein AMJ57_03880 [Parcubacteria bacterium SG8_24]